MTSLPRDARAQDSWFWRAGESRGDNWNSTDRWWQSTGSTGARTLSDNSSQNVLLTFDGSSETTQTNNVNNAEVRGLVFASGRSSTTINGNLLKIAFGGTGKIENASGNTQTINITLSNNTANGLEINPVNGLLNLSNIHLGTNFVDMFGNNTVHYRGNVSGSAVMTWKTNSGTVTAIFSASNTLTSSFNIERGYMVLSNASAYVGNGTINIGGEGNTFLAELQLGAGAAQTNALANSINIRREGGGTSANRSIASLSTSGTNMITGTVANTNSGFTAKIYIASGGTLRFSNVVSGAGGFYLDNGGGGTLELSSSNTITGGFYIDNGAIKLSGTSANAGNGNLSIGSSGGSSSATFWYSGTGGGITASNSLTVNSGTGGRTILSDNTSGVNTFLGSATLNKDLTFSNASGGEFRFGNTFSGTGGITKNGSGTMTFSGDASGIGGNITISAGTLQVGTGGTTGTIGNKNVDIGGNAIVFNRSDNLAYGGVISGTGGTFTKAGAGTLTLTNANTYTGATTVSVGALRASNNTALGTTAGGVVVASGAALELIGGITVGAEALNLSGTGLSSGGALRNISGNNIYQGTITNTAAALISSDAGDLTLSGAINATNQALTFGGAGNVIVSGAITNSSAGLTKQGAGTTSLRGANTYTGTTTIDAGVLQVTNGAAIADTAAVSLANVAGATLLVSTNETIGSLRDGGTTGGNVSIAGASTLTISESGTQTFAGQITNTGAVVKTNSGTTTLTGNNAFSGGLIVGQGTLRATTSANALGGGTLTLAGGNLSLGDNTGLSFNRNTTVSANATITSDRTSSGAGVTQTLGTLSIGAQTLTVAAGSNVTSGTAGLTFGATTLTGGATFTANSGTLLTLASITGSNQNMSVNGAGNLAVSGAITTGTGTLSKSGAGTLTLSGVNTYTGLTTVSAGALTLGGSAAIAGDVTVSGGAFNLGGNNQIGTTAVTVSGGTLDFSTFSDTVSSFTISSGTFTNGTLTASTYALQGGTVAGNLGAGTATVTSGTTTLNGTLGATTVNVNSGTMNLGSSDRLDNTAALTIAGGVLGLETTSDTVGSFTISSGTLGGTTGVLTASSYALQGGTVNAVLGAGGITVSSGTTALGSAGRLNSASSVTINSGQLTVAGNESVAALSGSGGTLSVSSGTFTTTFNSASNNFAGTISGAGGFAKAGSGTLSLSGDASGIGTISVSAGRLQIGNGSTTGTIGNDNVSLSSGADLAFNRSDNVTYNGVISGSGGTLTKLGNATLTISNTQTYTGATTISGGTLSYMGTNTSTATTVQSGATLAGTGSLGAVTVSSGGTISPGNSPGTLSVGNLTWAGGGNYNWQIYDAAGTAGATNGYDTILGNSLNITADTGNKFNINIWSLSGIGPDTNGNAINFTNANSTNWTLGTFTNGITNFSTGVFSINTAATNGTTGFSNSFTGTFSLSTNSTNVILVYTAAAGTYEVSVGANTAANQGTAQATNSVAQFTGNVALNKLGAGTLIMTNPANDYTGVTTVKEGTIQINVNAPSGSAGAFGNAISAVLVGDSTTNLAAGFNIGVANVTNDRNLTVVAGTGAADRIIGTTIASGQAVQAGGITFNTNAVLNAASGGTMLYSGLLSGSGNLTISNSGTSIFSASNSYSGTTTILTNATLRIANNNSLGATNGGTTVNSGGTLALSNGITIADALTLTGAGVAGTNGALRNISGDNTVSGAITLGSGGATIANFVGSSTMTLSGGISGAGQPLVLTNNNTITITNTGINTSTGGSLVKAGSGALLIYASSDYTGGTTFAGSGTMRLGNNGALGTGTITVTGSSQALTGTDGNTRTLANNLVLSNTGTLSLSASSPNNGDMIFTGTVDLGGANRALGINNNVTFSNTVSNGGITKNNAGALWLYGNNTYSGGTVLNAGTIRVGSDTALGTGAVTNNAGSVAVTADGATARTLANNWVLTNDITLGASSTYTGALTLNGTIDLGTAVRNITNASAVTLGGVVSGTGGGINKAGSGVLTLTGANTYTGGTTIGAGTLQIGSGGTTGSVAGNITNNATLTYNRSDNLTQTGVISGTGVVTKSGAGTVTLSGANSYSGGTLISAGALQGNTTSLQGIITNNSLVIFDQSTDGTYSSVLSGTGALIKTNAGVLTLTGANTQSGGTLIGQGTLSIGGGGTTGSLAGAITNNATLTYNRSDNLTQSTAISGTGRLTKSGAGTVTLSGANTYSGGTLVSAGALQGSTTSLQGTITNNSVVIFDQSADGTYSSVLSGTGVLVKTNTGVVTLTGANTQSGGTIIGGGTLSIGSGGTTGSLAGVITNNAALIFNRSDALTQSAVISGTGTVTNQAGTLTLSGANTFSGGFTLAGGTLVIGDNSALGTGAATFANGVTVNSDSTARNVTNEISFQNLQIGGSGALTLGGTLTHTRAGGSTITNNNLAGLTLGNINLANSTVNRIVTFAGTGNTAVTGVIANGGSTTGSGITLDASGTTLTLSGANSYGGDTTITAGTLLAANNTALGNTTGATTVANGATLSLSNNINSSEAVTINGLGVGSAGALQSVSGANTNTGTISLGSIVGTNSIAVATGSSLTIGDVNFVAGGRNLTIAANGTLLATGNFTNATANTKIQKDGTAALIISNAGSSGAAQLQIANGTVTLAAGSYSTSTSTATRALDLGLNSADNPVTNTVAFYLNSGLTMSNSIYVAPQTNSLGTRIVGTESTSGTATFNNQMYLGGDVQLTSAGSANLVYSGNITNDGTHSVTKVGLGTLTLSGVNTWAGQFIAGAGTTILSGGITDTNAVTISNGATLRLAAGETIGSIAGGGNIELTSNQLIAGQNNSNTEFSGIMSSTATNANFVKKGSGVLTLSGANTMNGQLYLVAGNTLFATNQGVGFTNIINLGEDLGGTDNATLTLGGSGVTLSNLVNVRSGSSNNTMLIAASNSTGTSLLAGGLTLNRAATLSAQSGGALTVSNAVTLNANQLRVTNAANSAVTIVGNISSSSRVSGELLIDGPGTTTLTGNNSGDLKLTLGSGTLVVGNITNLGDPTSTFFGDKLNMNGGTLSATNDVTAGANFGVTVSANGGNFNASSGKTLKFVDFINDAGAGSAAYTLGIGGGGTVVLEKTSGNNQFNSAMTFSVTGGSTLSTPTLLALGASGSTNIISLNNGTFAYTSNSATMSQRFTIGASGGTVNVSTADQVLTLTNTTTFTGALTKSGSGILEINRANTGTAGATVSGGILRVGNASALGTGGTVAVNSGATLQITNNINFGRELNLSGNGTVSGALLSIGGVNTNSGGITLGSDAIIGVNAGSLVVSGNVTNAGNRLTLDTYGVTGTPLNVSGVISGNGGLTKIGGGTAVLSGANGYAGGTLISVGTLQVGAGGATGQLGSGNITNNATLAVDRTGALTISDAISGSGVLTKSSAGTLTLTGANSYNGGTLISAGAIAGTTTGIQGNITNNAALIFDQSGSGTYSGIMSGTGTLAMTNTGTVTLTGANTFAGGVTVNGGTLVLNRSGGPALGGTNAVTINTNGTLRTDAAGQLVGAPLVTVNAGGTYNLNGFNQTNALTGGGSVTLGAGTLSISNTGSDTFSGVISATTGGVTKIGSGAQTFSGNNTYTNLTTITGGTMSMASASGSNVFAGDILINGGTLNYGNTTNDQIANTATVTMSSGAFDVGSRTETIGSMVMSGGTLSKAGGVLTMSGASTLTGGTVSLSTTTAEITSGSSLTLGAVTFSYGNASANNDALNLGGGITTTGSGTTVFTNSLAGSGFIDLNNASRDFNIVSGTAMDIYWGLRSTTAGSGSLVKSGEGTLTLRAASTFTGGTTLSAGVLRLGNDSALGGTTILNGGTIASVDSTARSFANALTIGGDVTFGQASGGTGALTFSSTATNNLGAATRTLTTEVATTINGALGNGSITKAGAGSLILNNASSSFSTLTVNAGTVAFQTNATITGLAGSGTGALNLAGGTLTVNASANSTFGQVVSGTGALTKSGAATVTLSGNNSYSGATTINAGTLSINGTNTSSAVTINSGGTLAGIGSAGATTVKSGGFISPGNSIGTLSVDTLTLEGGGGYVWEVANVTGTAGTDYDLISVGAGAGASTVTATSGNPYTIYLTSYTGFTNWNSGGTFSWNIIDWGSVTGFDASAFTVNTNNFSGTVTGAFTFANTNGYLVMTYTAGTPIYNDGAGTWSGGFNPALANGNNAEFTGAGGNATNNISSATVASIGNLTFSNTAGAYTLSADSGSAGFDAASRLAVNGSIVNNSTNLQTINMALGFDAARTIDAAAGNMTFGSTISNGVGLTFTGSSNNAVTGVMSGAGTVTKTGTGSLFLNGANTYTGATTISNGVVQLGNAAALGATNGGTTVISGATLDLNGQTVVGEALSLAGTGVGSNGALINSSASASSLSGAVTLTGNSTVGTTGNMTLSGAVGGAFSLTKIGAATLTLGGNNTYSGGTVVSAGAVFANNNNGFGTGTITVNGGGIGSTGSRTIGNDIVAGADFFMGGSTTTYGGGFNLGGATRTVTFSNSATFNGIISNGGLTISAAGLGQDVTFGAANTYTGATTINGGDVILSGAGAISGSSAVNITASAGNARFDISGITADSTTIGSLAAASSANATVNLGSKTLIAGGDNTSTTFGGVISNTGSFVKAGTGTTTITRASTYTGATTISNGEIALSGSGALSSSSALNLAGGSARLDISLISASGATNGSLAGATGSVVNLGSKNLNVGGDNTSTTFAGILTNTGSLTKSGTGTMTLSGANTFSGGSTLSAGVLRVANANALGTGSLAASAGTVLEVTNGINVANNLSVYSVRFLNGGNTLSGTITNNNTVYDVAAGTTNTLSGFVTGSGGVELIGGGVLNITGTTNNYTGNTTISNGTLRISTLANSNTVSSIGVSNNVTLAGANATNAVLDYTGGNVSTDRAFVMNDGGGTINMATSTTEMTLTGSASGTGKLIVGEGTLILSNATANSFAPGSIQVDSGATLQLAANNQIGNSTGLILNGGTFRVGTATTGFSDTLGTLTLSASSTIDLGTYSTGVRQLTFANSSAITWTGTLTITNWQGVALQSSDVAEILFGTGGLTSTQLGQIYFANQNINGGTLIGGELVPIPEPRVYAAAVALLAAVGWRERKRLRELLAKGLAKKSVPPKA